MQRAVESSPGAAAGADSIPLPTLRILTCAAATDAAT